MKKWIYIILFSMIIFCSHHVLAQEQQADSTENITDDIQVDVKSVQLEAEGDTLAIELFLISYQRNPREFKLNTYATQVIDSDGQQHLFSSIKMGRVLVQLTDQQNYLHYLLEEDVPVSLTIKIGDWQKRRPYKAALVFEDSTEEGRFITQEVDLR